MTACASARCPVPEPHPRLVAAVSGHQLPAGTSMARGHRSDLSPAGLPPAGVGRPGRFSPLPDVSHVYVARMASAAVLETALRDLAGDARTVYRPMLAGWAVAQVTTTADLRLADLRNDALAALDLRPEQLTTAGPAHYGCTGEWAAALHDAGFDGAVWHSRQAALHRAHTDREGGIARLLTSHAAIEVAVGWCDPAVGVLAADPRGPSEPLLDDRRRPSQLIYELAALLGLVVEAG